MRFATQRLLIAIASVCIVGGAILWGNYLLGTAFAILFGLLTCGATYLVYRAFGDAGRFQFLRRFVACLIAIVVLKIVVEPTWFNRDFEDFIEDHRMERVTGSQLHQVFSGDSRFANLAFECSSLKGLVVFVYGRIETESDLRDLRKRIFETCPDVPRGALIYRTVTVQESGKVYDDCDQALFEDSPPQMP